MCRGDHEELCDILSLAHASVNEDVLHFYYVNLVTTICQEVSRSKGTKAQKHKKQARANRQQFPQMIVVGMVLQLS